MHHGISAKRGVLCVDSLRYLDILPSIGLPVKRTIMSLLHHMDKYMAMQL